MVKVLKHITLGDEDYFYIENGDRIRSIDGYRFEVDEDVRYYFGNTGGFVRDMFDPLQNEFVKEVIILFIEVPIKGQLVGIYFKSEGGFEDEYRLTSAGRFIEVVKDKLNEGEIDFEVINTLEEVYKHPEYKMSIFLDEYVNPKSVNDTGFYIGDVMVGFNENIETVNEYSVREVLDCLGEMDAKTLIYKDLEISKINFTINEPNPLGMDVTLTFSDCRGETYNYLYELLLKELGRAPKGEEYKEFVERDELETLYAYAVDLNGKLNRRIKRSLTGEVDKTYRARRVERMIEEYERELEFGKREEWSMCISYMLMSKFLERGLIKKS